MRTIIAALHDIWCTVTARCRVHRPDDPLVTELRHQEKEAWREVGRLRQERAERDPVTRTLLGQQRRGRP